MFYFFSVNYPTAKNNNNNVQSCRTISMKSMEEATKRSCPAPQSCAPQSCAPRSCAPNRIIVPQSGISALGVFGTNVIGVAFCVSHTVRSRQSRAVVFDILREKYLDPKDYSPNNQLRDPRPSEPLFSKVQIRLPPSLDWDAVAPVTPPTRCSSPLSQLSCAFSPSQFFL